MDMISPDDALHPAASRSTESFPTHAPVAGSFLGANLDHDEMRPCAHQNGSSTAQGFQ